ncbi:MAG: Sua5/YciO/YrdC/YwlC family protein, partial [Natronospirillum sp.]
ETAVRRILQLKQRPVSKGLILVAGHWDTLAPLLKHLSDEQLVTLQASWPGPMTWLIPRPPGVPDWIVGNFDTLAVRLSAHPTVAALTQAVGAPIVSTSANRAGRRPARHGFQVRQWLGSQVDLIYPGSVGGAAQPSTIRDLTTGHTVR